MNFSRGGELLCCCSDKGTLHVYQISGAGSGGHTSSSSSLVAASGALLGGERPFASGAIPREQPALCAFINNTSVAGTNFMQYSLCIRFFMIEIIYFCFSYLCRWYVP